MALVGFPKPVRRGPRKGAEAVFALRKPAELDREGAEQDGRANHRAERTNCDDHGPMAPWRERDVLHNADGYGERVPVHWLDRVNLRNTADIPRCSVGAATTREVFIPRRGRRELLANHPINVGMPADQYPVAAEQADRLATPVADRLVKILEITCPHITGDDAEELTLWRVHPTRDRDRPFAVDLAANGRSDERFSGIVVAQIPEILAVGDVDQLAGPGIGGICQAANAITQCKGVGLRQVLQS